MIQNGESALQQDLTKETELTASAAEEEPVQPDVVKFVIDIDGCVKKPGVYEIDEGTRLYEVIEMAGGLTKSADTTLINQAEVLYDGQKITIPGLANGDETSQEQTSMTAGMSADGRININVADAAMLQEIPGIGPVTAEKIISYRETSGKFKSIEEIKNVDGIGDKTFEKIKDMITV